MNKIIANIKKLLPYCLNEEVLIKDSVVGWFFHKYVNSKEGLKPVTWTNAVYPVIGFSKIFINKEPYPLRLSYVYTCDPDAVENVTYYRFNDDEVVYDDDFLSPKSGLDYSDIPDYIWKEIESKVYEAAKSNITSKLREAKDSIFVFEEELKEIYNIVNN